jgi:hypothetical protein
MDVDDSGKIVFEIKNGYPLELLDLTKSFASLAREYESYANGEFEGEERGLTRLYVSEIRSGSIIAELYPHAAGLLPLLADVKTVIGFATTLKTVIDWLRTPKMRHKPPVTKNTLNNIKTIVEPAAKDSSTQININAETINNNVINHVHIHVDSHEARAVQNAAQREIEEIERPSTRHLSGVDMYFHQARKDTSQNGDRAVIESFSRKSVKVVFGTDKIKLDMLGDDIFGYAFEVNVDVQITEGRPSLYKVTKLRGKKQLPRSGQLDVD